MYFLNYIWAVLGEQEKIYTFNYTRRVFSFLHLCRFHLSGWFLASQSPLANYRIIHCWSSDATPYHLFE